MNLSNNKIRIGAIMIGWGIIMAFFLVLHFNTYNLCILLAAVIYLLYIYIIKGIKNADENPRKISLADSLGRLAGLTGIILLGYYISSFYPFSFFQWEAEGYQFLVGLFFKRLLIIFSEGNPLLLFSIILIFVLGIVKINPKKYKVLDLLYRYISFGSVFFYIFYAWTGNVRISLFYFAVVLIYALCGILEWKNKPNNKIKRNRWYEVFSVILLLFIVLENTATVQMVTAGYLEYYLLVKGLRLGNIVFISAILIGGMIICFIYEEKDQVIQDEFLLLLIESAMIVSFFIYRFYVGYWWIILSIYIIVSMVYVLIGDKQFGKEKNSKRRILEFLLIPVGTIFLTYEAHKGKILSATLFCISVILIYLLNKKRKQNEKNWISIAKFSSAILCFVGVTSAGYIYEMRNLASNYVLLILTGAMFVGLIWATCYNPKLFTLHYEPYRCGIIVCFFAIICAAICFKGGSTIKITDVEKCKEEVSVSARGKKNSVKDSKIYWMPDFFNTVFVQGEIELPEEMEFGSTESSWTFDGRNNGRLRVVVIDEYGIKTTGVRWYHTCNYKSEEK